MYVPTLIRHTHISATCSNKVLEMSVARTNVVNTGMCPFVNSMLLDIRAYLHGEVRANRHAHVSKIAINRCNGPLSGSIRRDQRSLLKNMVHVVRLSCIKDKVAAPVKDL